MPRIALSIFIYAVLAYIALLFFGSVLLWVGAGIFVAAALSNFLMAVISNFYTLRIYEQLALPDIGLHWHRGSGRNLVFGLAGGAGSAALVLLPAILTHAAHFRAAPENEFAWATAAFVPILLLFGSAGEEILFR